MDITYKKFQDIITKAYRTAFELSKRQARKVFEFNNDSIIYTTLCGSLINYDYERVSYIAKFNYLAKDLKIRYEDGSWIIHDCYNENEKYVEEKSLDAFLESFNKFLYINQLVYFIFG